MRKIRIILIVFVIIFLLLYFIPYPHRINAEFPARLVGEEGEYTFSLNARRHNYLLKRDTLIPEIKIYQGDETMFSFVDIDYSMYNSSIPIEGDENISYVSFAYYDGKNNILKPAKLRFSETRNIYMLETEDFTCFAPYDVNEAEFDALIKNAPKN